MKKPSSKKGKAESFKVHGTPGHDFDAYENQIVDFGVSLIQKMLAKYRKGRAEHGGSPTSVDCQKEINLEVLDILNYHLIDKVNAGSPVTRETKKKN